MALTLVPRSARALSAHLNAFFRVWKGIDPDSLAVRLPSSGSFRVLHSVTASPVLDVTDAGIDGADIRTGTITSDKLAGGIPVPANSITTAEIADGTIGAVDIAAGAISRSILLAAIPTSTASQGTAGVWYDLPGAQVVVPSLSLGSVMVYLFSMVARHSAANGRNAFRLVRKDGDGLLGQATTSVGHATATGDLQHVGVGAFACPVSGTLTFGLQAFMTDAGTATVFPANGYLQLVELRR